MASRSTLAGIEVPITGSDSIKWVELSVADCGSITSATTLPLLAPLTEDCASCFIIGDPSLYVIWRVHKNLPRTLEVLELSANEEFARIGLRITFPDALCPLACICENKIGSLANPYLLYALTISGVAYSFKLRNVSRYTSSVAFSPGEIIEFNLRSYFDNVRVTSVAATAGCLVVGQNDGSVACIQLGLLDQTTPGATSVRLWMGEGIDNSSLIPLAILYRHTMINMLPDDISRIQLELVQMIQDIVFDWLMIHFLCTMPFESPGIEDSSSQLSSLQIGDGSTDKRSWNEKLGKCDFTLAFILLPSIRISYGDPNHPSSRYLPNPQ